MVISRECVCHTLPRHHLPHIPMPPLPPQLGHLYLVYHLNMAQNGGHWCGGTLRLGMSRSRRPFVVLQARRKGRLAMEQNSKQDLAGMKRACLDA